MKVMLTVSYEGTQYSGWQKQNNSNTIQEEIENALKKIYSQDISILGASRTDAGVHALGQVASFTLEKSNIPIEKLPLILNTLLPDDIVITNAQIASEHFHPRYNAKNKLYQYKIHNSQYRNPLLRNFSWNISQELDIEKMKQAAEHFIGEKDFRGFCSTGGDVKSTIRTITQSKISIKDNDLIIYSVEGNGFLYNMVRIIVGTLVYVGLGKIAAEDIPQIINSCNRNNAGKTAPPQGLCLVNVYYE